MNDYHHMHISLIIFDNDLHICLDEDQHNMMDKLDIIQRKSMLNYLKTNRMDNLCCILFLMN